MTILAFDTCFNACSVAIGSASQPDTPMAGRKLDLAAGHAEHLVGMIAEVMQAAGVTFGDIGRIAVTVGPGTFTGTRVGIAAARALRLAHDIPAFGLTSLALLAREAATCPAPNAKPLLVAVDARNGESYIQAFDAAGLQPQTDPDLVDSATVETIADTLRARVVSPLPNSYATPDARYAIAIASQMHYPSRDILPLYLRAPDAKPSTVAELIRQ